MIKSNNKQNNEVYILGADAQDKKHKISTRIKWGIFIVGVMIISAGIFLLVSPDKDQKLEYYFEPEDISTQSISLMINDSSTAFIREKDGYTQKLNDTINDVPLSIYIPHNARMSLCIGMPDKKDSTIIFAAMAADIRKDNEDIVGDFVLSGKQLSRGIAKKGFCAIIDNTITIGSDDDTPLLQEAIDKEGYFFRQYLLVSNNELVDNKPKNKSIRRAIGIRNEQIIMIESQNNESFHDFSQALIDIGISDAIYLIGGNAYGWYYDQEHTRYEFGKEQANLPPNISYIVWQTK